MRFGILCIIICIIYIIILYKKCFCLEFTTVSNVLKRLTICLGSRVPLIKPDINTPFQQKIHKKYQFPTGFNKYNSRYIRNNEFITSIVIVNYAFVQHIHNYIKDVTFKENPNDFIAPVWQWIKDLNFEDFDRRHEAEFEDKADILLKNVPCNVYIYLFNINYIIYIFYIYFHQILKICKYRECNQLQVECGHPMKYSKDHIWCNPKFPMFVVWMGIHLPMGLMSAISSDKNV